jgi:hypothetical protein
MKNQIERERERKREREEVVTSEVQPEFSVAHLSFLVIYE